MHISSKLPDVGVTIFSTMSAEARQNQAINLSQGFPSFAPDRGILESAYRHMQAGRNQYAPSNGVPELCQVLSQKAQALYGAEYDPQSEVTVTSGATEALFNAITAVVRPGDRVLIFEPAYDSYAPAVRLNGGIPVFVSLRAPKYEIDWAQVDPHLTDLRLIIVNSPHNPTGTILQDSDLNALAQRVEGSPTLILSDEVYEHSVFDGQSHASMARHPELRRRSFIVGSLGKTYHMTGWKIGYCLAPAALSAEFRKVHQYVTFASATPLQLALAEALEDPHSYQQVPALFQKKRDIFARLMADTGFVLGPCQGTYFQVADYSRLSDEPDREFCLRLVREFGVAAIPLSPFFHNGQDDRRIRFCFAKEDAELRTAAQRLARLEVIHS